MRRKTDPKTGKHTLCEPARSKGTRTFHKSHFVEIYGESAVCQDREAHFVRACAIERYTDVSQEPFCVEIYRESAVCQARDTRFARACEVEMHMDMSEEAFCAEIYRENAKHFRYHLD